jgi:AraC-like DNA-binding protein
MVADATGAGAPALERIGHYGEEMTTPLLRDAEQSYVERLPVPALADLVSAVFIQRIAPGGRPYRQRHTPNGSVELTCRLGAAPAVVGPLTGPFTQVLAPGTAVVGLRFRPGAAPSVLGLPASEHVDLVLEADLFWGHTAAMLGEQVNAAASPEQALTVLQTHLVDRLPDASPPDPLVSGAVRRLMPGRANEVTSLTSTLYVSERSLRRRCLAAVGVPPKTLHRLLRFQGVLAAAQQAIARGRAPTEGGLARVAADAGYADHSHLDRECRRLTGVSARTFFLETAEQCACGHDHAASYEPLLPSTGALVPRSIGR